MTTGALCQAEMIKAVSKKAEKNNNTSKHLQNKQIKADFEEFRWGRQLKCNFVRVFDCQLNTDLFYPVKWLRLLNLPTLAVKSLLIYLHLEGNLHKTRHSKCNQNRLKWCVWAQMYLFRNSFLSCQSWIFSSIFVHLYSIRHHHLFEEFTEEHHRNYRKDEGRGNSTERMLGVSPLNLSTKCC